MLIDWFTVGAQTLNFLILVWLLKRFLYQPILNAIDSRERNIAAILADADAKKAEACTERDTYRYKNTVFEQQRDALMRQAIDEAANESKRLHAEARKEADELRNARRAGLNQELQNISTDIKRITSQEVFMIVRKVLKDLAGTDIEVRMSEVFIQRLRTFDDSTKANLIESLHAAKEPVVVRSAFALPIEQRDAIQGALNTLSSTHQPVCFETADDVLSGIEMVIDGEKLAWSIADYTLSLEKKVSELFAEPEVLVSGKEK